MGEAIRRGRADLNPHLGGSELQPTVERMGEGITVRSTLSLGVQPSIKIAWEVERSFWRGGFRLLGFRSTSGFSPERYPKDLAKHGAKFLEETADGERHEALSESTYYYTFLLRGPGFLGLGYKIGEPVLFSETVPSARVGIQRIEQKLKLEDLHDEIESRDLKREVAQNELELRALRSRKALADARDPTTVDPLEASVKRAVDAKIRDALIKARTRIDMTFARQKLEREVTEIPGWQKLKPEQRRKIKSYIAHDFDIDEESLDVG